MLVKKLQGGGPQEPPNPRLASALISLPPRVSLKTPPNNPNELLTWCAPHLSQAPLPTKSVPFPSASLPNPNPIPFPTFPSSTMGTSWPSFPLRMKRASSLNFLNKSVEEPAQVWWVEAQAPGLEASMPSVPDELLKHVFIQQHYLSLSLALGWTLGRQMRETQPLLGWTCKWPVPHRHCGGGQGCQSAGGGPGGGLRDSGWSGPFPFWPGKHRLAAAQG